MRTVNMNEISRVVKGLCMEAAWKLPDDVLASLKSAIQREESPLAKEILKQIIDNDNLAAEEKVPMCMDTGVSIVFVDLGQEVMLKGEDTLQEAIDRGVREGFEEGYLRSSVVSDPIRRINPGDNTPAVVHLRLVTGDKIKLKFMAKGGGAEHMSRMSMLSPTTTIEELEEYVVETVKIAGPNACPPVIVGVGLGGTYETVGLLAKRSLLRPLGSIHNDSFYADLERRWLEKINHIGIGPQGLGGRTTALAVHIMTARCDMSNLPVGVNFQCHAARQKFAII